MGKNISGIQQVGIGVSDVQKSWKWYREKLGMDIRIFEEKAVAEYMLHYTEGKVRNRYAALAINMEGGGGFEIWQHLDFTPRVPAFDIKLGNTGIFICKMKCRDIRRAWEGHKKMDVNLLGPVTNDPQNHLHYYLTDPYNNIFEVVEESDCFIEQKSLNGGVAGVVAGVSDIDKSMKVYSDILQYTEVVYDKTGVFEDFKGLPGGNEKYRRVLLKHKLRKGPFSKLYGPTQIELVQAIDRQPKSIFQGRIWGELGFIHLCFDVSGLNDIKKECTAKGFPFTVDSGDHFDMGTAAGSFAYISDPDGTPIEFVETHKVPIFEKLGIYLHLEKRDPLKSFPSWIIKALRFSRVKD